MSEKLPVPVPYAPYVPTNLVPVAVASIPVVFTYMDRFFRVH